MSKGPATHAQMAKLHRSLTEQLLDRMKGASVPLEWLKTARGLLSDQKALVLSFGQSRRDRKALHDVYMAYCRHLAISLKSGSPSAAHLAEARAWLTMNGVRAHDAESLTMSAMGAVLEAMPDLPFH
jgi:hypothetical protein